MPYRKKIPPKEPYNRPQGITVPYQFSPRSYQERVMKAITAGEKRAVCVWHRRSGKDKTAINIMAKEMLRRVGSYFYFFPTYAQGRKVLWEGMDKAGMPFLNHFPKEIVANKNTIEMKLTLVNGSILRIVGTDNIDSVVGTNPVGCVFSEYSLQNPVAWDYVRPILAENGGFAIFLFTPRGKNHGWRILEQAKSEGWFSQILAYDDTWAIEKDVIAKEQKEMPQDLFEQEYACKFIEGASSFFKGVDDCVVSGDDLVPEPGHTYRIGVDLARYQDYTVITPFDLHTFRVGRPERFNQMEWEFQRSQIETNYLRWNRATVAIDRTVIGQPIAEALKNRGINIEEVNITSELKDMQFSLSENGIVDIDVPSKHTDDMIFSLALAVRNVGVPLIPEESIESADELPLYPLQSFE